jgi:hypothetical protein
VLFKMHKFEPGIIYLCDKGRRGDELLHYFMSNPSRHNMSRMLEECQKKGSGDLYIQTVKFLLNTYCTAHEN